MGERSRLRGLLNDIMPGKNGAVQFGHHGANLHAVQHAHQNGFDHIVERTARTVWLHPVPTI